MNGQKITCPGYKKGENKPCVHYGGFGKCEGRYYYCIEYFKRKKPILSFSSIKDFERCPYRFYLSQFEGIQLREEYLSVHMKMGIHLHRLVKDEHKLKPVKYSYDEEIYQSITYGVYSKIKDYELIPENLEKEVRIEKDNLHGIIDLAGDNFFGEIKFTSKPDLYLHSFTALSQLEFYFYLSDQFELAFMLPIRIPGLKQSKDEENEKFLTRVVKDIRRRPSYYFPHLKEEKRPFKWGLRFYKCEFDLHEFKKRMEWISREIQRCCQVDYFPQRKVNCFFPSECEYLSICETGNINEGIYERRIR